MSSTGELYRFQICANCNGNVPVSNEIVLFQWIVLAIVLHAVILYASCSFLDFLILGEWNVVTRSASTQDYERDLCKMPYFDVPISAARHFGFIERNITSGGLSSLEFEKDLSMSWY